MKRTAVNMVVDAAAFAAFVLMLSTGLLLRYQLPPGSGDVAHGGLGRGAQDRPITLLWGLSRHQWGDVHYWIALALIGILAVHVVVHWKWIVCVVRGRQTDASGTRLGLGLVCLVAIIVVALLPMLSGTRQVPRSELRPDMPATQLDIEQEEDLPGDRHVGPGTLRGWMTLRETADEYNVPVSFIVEQLDLPEDVSPDERLGQLGQRYGFRMGDVRQALEQAEGEQGEARSAQ